MGSDSAKCYIAVVDDDESLCRSMERLLRASGYHPLTYQSAEAFLADLARPALGCLILDYQLDGMSGIELAEQLAMSGWTIPVVFITAHAEPEVFERMRFILNAPVFLKSDPCDRILVAINQAIHGEA